MLGLLKLMSLWYRDSKCIQYFSLITSTSWWQLHCRELNMVVSFVCGRNLVILIQEHWRSLRVDVTIWLLQQFKFMTLKYLRYVFGWKLGNVFTAVNSSFSSWLEFFGMFVNDVTECSASGVDLDILSKSKWVLSLRNRFISWSSMAWLLVAWLLTQEAIASFKRVKPEGVKRTKISHTVS